MNHPAPRVHETPNAVMTTLASPTLNGATLAVWRVEMAPGAAGPLHAVDAEQVLVLLDGALTVHAGDETRRLCPGEAIVLPAGLDRQIVADDVPAAALVTSAPGATATVAGKEPVPIPWAA